MGSWTPVFAGAAGLVLQLACGGGGGGASPAVQAPAGLVYASNPAVYTKGQPAPANTPTVSGGAATSFAVSPALPAGLALNAASGVISGTPSALAPAATYVVTASNGGGSASASLQLTVNDVPPSNLAYSAASAVYTKGVPIAPNTPSNTGGAVVSYSISPALPSGLALNPGTGIISGMPASVAASAPYTVTAVNSGGTATATLTLAVQDVAPANLAYSTPVATYFRGVPIAANLPSSTGGAPTLYAVAPALPAGLSLNPATGVISGTPTVLAGTSAYTVTASNSGGSASVDLSIRVVDAAPANLAYAANPAVYVKGTAIAPNVPSNTGGAITAYAVSPALPAGLVLDPVTGVLTGTPAAAAAPASYVVTGSNSTGSATAVLVVTVNEPPPGTLTYATNPASYTKGKAITPNVPSNSGGPIASFSVAPALPAGLALDPGTGILSGTPTALAPTAAYTVTGTGVDGSPATAVLTLTVKDVPPSISYGSSSFTFTTGAPVALNPTNSGGPAVSWAISPATLPAGLSFSTATGSITGTPTAITPPATFTITATNSGGSMSVSPSIRVNPPAPVITAQPAAATVYRGQTATFTVAATGTGTLGYQWRKNGTAISGATSASYTTPATVLADNNAAFSVVVSDTYGGSRTSSNAALTVNSGWTPTGALNLPRVGGHTSILLNNGRVLVAGGSTSSGSTSTAEIYNPNTGAFTMTGAMAFRRTAHTATVLPDGKVLIAGGIITGTSTGELYDPQSGTFANTAGSMVHLRSSHAAVLLNTGKVLLVGGYGGTSPATFADLASSELYDPATGSFTASGSMHSPRYGLKATLLADGRVLVFGGTTGGFRVDGAELYDPSTGLFTNAAAMIGGRSSWDQALLLDGKVLIAGGNDASGILLTGQVFDPASNTVAPGGSLHLRRDEGTLSRLPSGKVLFAAGGIGNFYEDFRSEIYDPTTGQWAFGAPTLLKRISHRATVLQDGKVLILGGVDPVVGGGVGVAEIYE